MAQVYLNPKLIGGEAQWGEEVDFHTPARLYVFPGRRILDLPCLIWPHTPEDCPGGEDYGGTWLFEDTVLVCSGCGLDCT
jgi:hypothetical protein